MDRLNPLAIPLHPVTKTWVYSIVALGAATSMDIVSPAKLVFFPSRVFAEPWRLVSSFCFFGPLQFTLLQYVLIIARTNNSLEGQYLYRMEFMPINWICNLDSQLRADLRQEFERRKTVDFAYFMARIGMSAVVAIVVLSRWVDIAGNFFLLGPALEKILLYILCRTTPTDHLQIMGISIKAKYAPFLTQFLEFLFSSEFKSFNYLLLFNKNQAVRLLLASSLVRQTVLVFGVGHVWWFLQFFYLESAFDEVSSRKQRELTVAYAALTKSHSQWLDLPNLYRHLITPPWYFFFTRSLMRKQANSTRHAQMRSS